VLESPLAYRLLQPSVVTARSDFEHPAHCANVKALGVGLNKLVGLTHLSRTGFRTHRHSSTPVTPLASRVHKILGSKPATSSHIYRSRAAVRKDRPGASGPLVDIPLSERRRSPKHPGPRMSLVCQLDNNCLSPTPPTGRFRSYIVHRHGA